MVGKAQAAFAQLVGIDGFPMLVEGTAAQPSHGLRKEGIELLIVRVLLLLFRQFILFVLQNQDTVWMLRTRRQHGSVHPLVLRMKHWTMLD